MLFIDTGPLYARADAKDRHHTMSVAAWNHLAGSHWKLVTSEHVFDELLTLISRRLRIWRAVAFDRHFHLAGFEVWTG